MTIDKIATCFSASRSLLAASVVGTLYHLLASNPVWWVPYLAFAVVGMLMATRATHLLLTTSAIWGLCKPEAAATPTPGTDVEGGQHG